MILDGGSAEDIIRQVWSVGFDALPEPIALLDPEQRVLRLNRAMVETLGAEPSVSTGRYCYEVVHGTTQPPADCPFAMAVEKRGPCSAEILEARMGGLFQVSVSPVLDNLGNVVAVIHHARDITQQRAADDALRESEEKYRTLVENSHDLVYIYSGDRCLFANRRVLEVTGYTADEVAGLDIFSFVHPDDRQRLREHSARRFRGESAPASLTARIMDKTGDIHWVEISAGLITFMGRPAILGVARDTTDRVKAEHERLEMERRFQHMQRLESLGVMAGGIAHDFNNLLMAVLGHLGLALVDSPPDGPLRLHLLEAERTAHRAVELTRQMLTYSGRGHFHLQTIDLSLLVNEMADLLRTSIAKTALLELQLQKPLPAIKADRDQVEQILLNLVLNASEALDAEGGTISVRTGVIDADQAYLARCRSEVQTQPGHFAFLEVEDTGSGMDAETLERLFEPFFTTKFTGRGLGLAAVMGIVRGHDGSMLIESGPGRGTLVRVLLPAEYVSGESQVSAVVAGPSPPASPAVATGTILIVDDEDAVRMVATRMLTRLGFKAVEASDGDEAVALIERGLENPDCVILDLTMPRLGGLAALERLRQLRPNLPVILSSGFDEGEWGDQSNRERLRFLQKPYDLKRLRAELQMALVGAVEPGDQSNRGA